MRIPTHSPPADTSSGTRDAPTAGNAAPETGLRRPHSGVARPAAAGAAHLQFSNLPPEIVAHIANLMGRMEVIHLAQVDRLCRYALRAPALSARLTEEALGGRRLGPGRAAAFLEEVATLGQVSLRAAPLQALASRIDKVPESDRGPAFDGILAALGPLREPERGQALLTLASQFDLLPRGAGYPARHFVLRFEGIVAHAARLPQAFTALAQIAARIAALPPAARASAFGLVSQALSGLPRAQWEQPLCALASVTHCLPAELFTQVLASLLEDARELHAEANAAALMAIVAQFRRLSDAELAPLMEEAVKQADCLSKNDRERVYDGLERVLRAMG